MDLAEAHGVKYFLMKNALPYNLKNEHIDLKYFNGSGYCLKLNLFLEAMALILLQG